MSNFASVISIVTRLPPAIDGVGDYALNLARQLRQDFQIQTHFIVCDPIWNGAAEIEGFSVSKISDRSLNALLDLLSTNRSSSILLHYVGYGYAQRGCPVWLVDGLQRCKSLFPKRSLVTMFHEISASGPPWTSAFWLSSLQRSLAARLAQMGDRCVTSKKLYAEIIIDISKGKHNQVLFLPVFSSIGEPDTFPLDLSKRQPRLVIFGGISKRARVYRNCQKTLNYVCQKLNIQEISDVGVPTGITPSSIGKVPIVEVGEQPAQKVSKILKHSLAGFSDYNPDYLAKSSIFAAYCSHRLLPINSKYKTLIVDGIEASKHYWVPSTKSEELEEHFNSQAIADNAYYWYSNHSLIIQAKTFAEILIN